MPEERTWLAAYDAHVAAVRRVIPAERLLVIDLEAAGDTAMATVCAFVRPASDANLCASQFVMRPFPRRNAGVTSLQRSVDHRGTCFHQHHVRTPFATPQRAYVTVLTGLHDGSRPGFDSAGCVRACVRAPTTERVSVESSERAMGTSRRRKKGRDPCVYVCAVCACAVCAVCACVCMYVTVSCTPRWSPSGASCSRASSGTRKSRCLPRPHSWRRQQQQHGRTRGKTTTANSSSSSSTNNSCYCPSSLSSPSATCAPTTGGCWRAPVHGC